MLYLPQRGDENDLINIVPPTRIEPTAVALKVKRCPTVPQWPQE